MAALFCRVMEEIKFTVDVYPRPRAEAKFRMGVREAAVKAFGTQRFWNEVWVYVSLTFIAGTKWRVRGDLDNYAKNVLDALCGVAYEDDSQVSGIYCDWSDDLKAGASIRVQGIDLFDMANAQEFSLRMNGQQFTFLLPTLGGMELQETIKQSCRRRVSAYFDMIKRGVPERDARGILPIVYHKYARKGPQRASPRS